MKTANEAHIWMINNDNFFVHYRPERFVVPYLYATTVFALQSAIQNDKTYVIVPLHVLCGTTGIAHAYTLCLMLLYFFNVTIHVTP